MAEDLAAARAVYLRLAAQLCRPGPEAWAGALRWVQSPGSGRPVRVGIERQAAGVSHRLPNRMAGGRGVAVVEWIDCSGAPRAQGWLRTENLDHSVGPGTLAAVLRSADPAGALFGLTAGHVVAGDPQARFGDRVELAAASDVTHRLFGRLHNWSPDLARSNRSSGIDAGLLRIDTAALEPLLDSIDWPAGWAEADDGTEVRLLTRHHRLPGRIASRITTAMDVGEPPVRYTLTDALCCDIDGGTQPGDSGAALWDVQQRLVGLHVGSAPQGSAGTSVACPIGKVLAWSGCTPVLRGESLLGEGRGPASSPPVRSVEPVQAALTAPRALDVLARTMWGEARGEPDARAGMGAVAHVVLNRVARPGWWGRTVEQVCLHPWQFSCWNVGDPNRDRLIAVGGTDPLFGLARSVAQTLLGMTASARALADPTRQATHYHAASLRPPAWTRRATRCARIGNHVFYRDVA